MSPRRYGMRADRIRYLQTIADRQATVLGYSRAVRACVANVELYLPDGDPRTVANAMIMLAMLAPPSYVRMVLDGLVNGRLPAARE